MMTKQKRSAMEGDWADYKVRSIADDLVLLHHGNDANKLEQLAVEHNAIQPGRPFDAPGVAGQHAVFEVYADHRQGAPDVQSHEPALTAGVLPRDELQASAAHWQTLDIHALQDHIDNVVLDDVRAVVEHQIQTGVRDECISSGEIRRIIQRAKLHAQGLPLNIFVLVPQLLALDQKLWLVPAEELGQIFMAVSRKICALPPQQARAGDAQRAEEPQAGRAGTWPEAPDTEG